MYKNAVGYASENERHKFIILDGDKRKQKFDPNDFSVSESVNFDFLKAKVLLMTGIDFTKLGFRIDGGLNGGDLNQKVKYSIKYLNFLNNNLDYLPKNDPKELIWDTDYATDLLKLMYKTIPIFSNNFKQNILDFGNAQFGDTSNDSIIAVKKQLIDNFIRNKNNDYRSIEDIILKYKFSVENP